MIDEAQQDQAALHALGLLEGEEAATFRAALAAGPELQALTDDLGEAAAALVHALPATKAPPEVLQRLHAQMRAERMHATPPRQFATVPHTNWQPLALAAGIAIAATLGFLAGTKIAGEKSQVQIDRLTSDVAQRESERQRLEKLASDLKNERGILEKRIGDLRQRDALAQVQIATLKSQLKAYSKVSAFAVWDAAGQQGIVQFDNLPVAAADKDYQMWVIDPRYPAPVSAGVFTAGVSGVTDVKFKPDQPIGLANKFAVSLERKGGSTGLPTTVILMSN